MTLDFSSYVGVFSLYKRNSSTVPNRFLLYSQYSNEPILNGEDLWLTNKYIPLTTTTSNDRYMSFTWLFTNGKLLSDDIGWYYRIEFYSDSIPVSTYNDLVKVVNNAIRLETTIHVSDNEANEQYTLFR